MRGGTPRGDPQKRGRSFSLIDRLLLSRYAPNLGDGRIANRAWGQRRTTVAAVLKGGVLENFSMAAGRRDVQKFTCYTISAGPVVAEEKTRRPTALGGPGFQPPARKPAGKRCRGNREG